MILLTSSSSSGSGSTTMIVWILVLVVFVVVFLVRPQRKEQQRQKDLMNSMEVGDTVLTSSGFYGTLIDITDDTVIVEFGNNRNCRIPMQRSAISQVEKAQDAVAKPEEEAAPEVEEKPKKGLFKK